MYTAIESQHSKHQNNAHHRVILKLKSSHYTPGRRLGGEEVYLPLILYLRARWGERSAWRPGRALAPGKGPPVAMVQEAEWAPEPVWTKRLKEKAFCLCRGSNLDRSVVQPVAKHYTDWATPTHYRVIHTAATSQINKSISKHYITDILQDITGIQLP
jgi:hypothetical protein